MEERELRVGVAGAGFIGAVHARSALPAGAALVGVADTYAISREDEPVVGLPVFADGLRAARLTQTVLESSATDEWVDVPALEPMEVAP